MVRQQAGCLSRGEMAEYWSKGQQRQTSRWANSKGPVDVIRLTLKRLHWTWPRPWVFCTDLQQELDLTMATPRLVKWHIKEAIRRLGEQAVSKDFASKQWEGAGQAVSSAAIRRVLRETEHSNAGKGIARAIALGSWWTTGRWAKAGYQIDDRCPLCGSLHEADSVWHRLWRCPATQDLRQSEEMKEITKTVSYTHLTLPTILLV